MKGWFIMKTDDELKEVIEIVISCINCSDDFIAFYSIEEILSNDDIENKLCPKCQSIVDQTNERMIIE